MVMCKACPSTTYSVAFTTVFVSFCLSSSCTCIRLSYQRLCMDCVLSLLLYPRGLLISLPLLFS